MRRWAAGAPWGQVAAGLCVALGAQAADDATLRAQLQQRLRLNAELLADGATVTRILASSDRRAAASLDEGRVHDAAARDLLAKGDLPGARRNADEALRHLALARRLAPAGQARQAAARQRYEQLMASLDRLIDAWRARLGPSEVVDGDLFAALSLIATAQRFASEARHDEGVHVLGQVESHVLSGMKRVLGSRTLDYTIRAGTPTEEFEAEAARHRGLLDLVPIALRDLGPRPEAQALIDRYAETSNTLGVQARQRLQSGEASQALGLIRSAVLYAQRALTSAGLVVPQSMEASP